MTLLNQVHERYVFNRRVERLAFWLSSVIPENASVLDIGAGDGSLDSLVLQQRPDVRISGLDVLVRTVTAVPMQKFDGCQIPFADHSWDVAMLVDVLHHTRDARNLVAEARRVAKTLIIKDHLNDGIWSEQTLKYMDYVGNARHGVVLPYDYWPLLKWQAMFRQLTLTPVSWQTKLFLYPFPLSLWFDRSLHFIAVLQPAEPVSGETARHGHKPSVPSQVTWHT